MTFTVAIIWANALFALVACVAMVLGARHSFPELRPMFAGGAALAALYVGSYTWLGFNIEHAADWSLWMRPVALVAWFTVWIVPTFVSVRLFRKIVTYHQQIGGE